MTILNLLPQTAAPEMPWTGDVKAFSYYVTAECLPQERLAVVYVARKRYEDGSTVTVVQNIPIDSLPALRSGTTGYGRIERDRNGVANRVVVRVAYRGDGPTTNDSEFLPDPRSGALVGRGTGPMGTARGLVLPARGSYLLDPLEALAFGSKLTTGSTWLFPTGILGDEAPMTSIGLRFSFSAPRPFAVELSGRREMFQRMSVVEQCASPRMAYADARNVGEILYHSDGSLAAFCPNVSLHVGTFPSDVSLAGTYGKSGSRPVAPPPFKLKGKMAEAWKQGLPVNSDRLTVNGFTSVFVPSSITAGEKASILANIEPPQPSPAEKPKTDADPSDG